MHGGWNLQERSLPARLLAKAERLLPEITPRAPGSK